MSKNAWLTRSSRDVDHDPEIDKFKTVFQGERLREKDLAVLAGVHVATVNKLFSGETKRPRHTTYAALAKAMGHEYTLSRVLKPVYKDELPQAYAEFKAHQELLKRQRDREARREKQKRNGK
jgi:transcriptional regulator with XRE-family HTH domain